MATSNITNTIEDPSGNPVENVRVVARLMPCGAFRTADSVEVAREVETISGSNGDWSLALERNAGLTPSNTVYRITEHIPAASGGPQVWTIQVGASDQTVLAALVDPPPAATASSFLTQASADARYQALGSLGSSTPSTIEPDDAGSAGVSTSASRADHEHVIAAAAPGTIAPDDTAAEGVATSFSRSDHRHGIVAAAPSNTGDSNSEGVATSFSRSDHVHKGVVANEEWTTWTPTLTNLTKGDGTVIARYQRLGRTINYSFVFTLGSTSAVSANASFTLPFAATASTAGSDQPVGTVSFIDAGTAVYLGTGHLAAAGSSIVNPRAWVASGTYTSFAGINSTIPFTWGTGDILAVSGNYEAAS